MTRLAEIQDHIAGMHELSGIVGAMRSLAGMRMQEAQNGLPSIGRYARSVGAAVSAAATLLSEPLPQSATGRSALIVCAAEHGFVGGFNERLLDAAQRSYPGAALFLLGSRGAALANERRMAVAWSAAMATRLAATPDTIGSVTSELYRRIARGEIARIHVIFTCARSGVGPTIEHRQVLPLDRAQVSARSRPWPPLHNLPPQVLFERLMAEYVFALLTEAAVEAIASENAARLAAMDAAHDNMKKKLAELDQQAREARQSEITAEILDLVTGTEASRRDIRGRA